MSRSLAPLSLAATVLAGTAYAEVPRVAVDIAPVHALVAQVMEGVGAPDLIVAPGASPHEYSLRPSQAQALQEADLVIWVGADLTPWLDHAIETLAPDAAAMALLSADATIALPPREDALFNAQGHDEEHDDAEDHGHADHDDHGHGEIDPHAWLLPDNAMAWLDLIAAELSQMDPENAENYRANAAIGRAEIAAATAEVAAMLDPVRHEKFIVFHDAYQYFERGFGFPASGAISLSDASDPSPARIAAIQTRIALEGVGCVLAEPQFNPGLVATVMDGADAKTGIIDPLGADLEPGAGLYPQLLRNMGTTLAGCF